MRIGVYGGTFDPIHQGHLIIAESIREDFNLDKVVFIPAAAPPHKDSPQMTKVGARLKMVELAIADNPYFEISKIEIQRGGISYTVDTVRTLRAYYPSTAELFLLIGADSLIELPTWKTPKELFNLCQVLVLPRPGFEINKAEERFRKKATLAKTPLIEICSTDIRRRVKEGKSIRYLVPPAVGEFIQKEGLYR